MGFLVLIALAVISYRIGEHQYRSGWPLAGASLGLSFIGNHFLPFFGMMGANLLLFIGITVYNLVSKKPPGSSSGF